MTSLPNLNKSSIDSVLCDNKIYNNNNNKIIIKKKLNYERGNWNSKLEFILSCLGYAIGIGNIWRFPYLCYRNGGGAFLIPFLLMLFVCGIPLFFMETCLGQFAGTGCITIYKISPIFKGVGYAIVIVNFIISVYYNVILSYPLLFLYKSMTNPLPWENCNNPWNTPKCLKITAALHHYGNVSKLQKDNDWNTPADEFFHREILQISDSINEPIGIVWPLFVCNCIAWIITYCCIRNGVKSVGKVIYFSATFPFLILGILFVRGVTLPGAMEGIKFYILPQWHQLTNLKVWADAAIQIFISLGPGWGGIVNMASYNNFRNNTLWDSIFVPITNIVTSIFAGFVVFSVLGFMSVRTGVPVSAVATSGPGLAFITYPEAISMMPFPQLWAALFFIMLFLLGIDSCFVQLEAVISSIIDEYPKLSKHKALVAFASCFLMFLCSISCVTHGGIYLVQLLDWYAGPVTVILICSIEAIIIGWIYGVDNFVNDIEFMIGKKVHWIWKLCWRYITPMILLFILVTTIVFNTEVTYNGKSYPKWSIYFGWSSSFISIVCIPIYIFYKLAKSKGTLVERIKYSLKPIDWGPATDENRLLWENYKNNCNK